MTDTILPPAPEVKIRLDKERTLRGESNIRIRLQPGRSPATDDTNHFGNREGKHPQADRQGTEEKPATKRGVCTNDLGLPWQRANKFYVYLNSPPVSRS